MGGYTLEDVESHIRASNEVNRKKQVIDCELSMAHGFFRKDIPRKGRSVLFELPLAGRDTHFVQAFLGRPSLGSFVLIDISVYAKPRHATEKASMVAQVGWGDESVWHDHAGALPLDLVRPFYETLPAIISELAIKFPVLRQSFERLLNAAGQ